MSLKLPTSTLPRTVSLGGLRITRLETPGSGYAGEWQDLAFEAHVEAETFQPGLAIAYIDGPADHVRVKWIGGEEDIPKGYFLAIYKRDTTDPSCAEFVWPEGGILYPEEGVYTLRLLAGYVKDSTFYYTDYRDRSFTAQAKPPPEEKPWWEQPWLFGLPVWQWIALGGGLSVIAIIAGIIAYEEREREMMYMLLLARRRG